MNVGTLKVILTLGISKFKAGLARATGLLGTFKRTMGGLGNMIKGLVSTAFNIMRTGLIAMGVALVGVTIAGARFEEAMVRTFTILKEGTQATVAQFDELVEKARELGRETLYSSTQAAQGMTILARSGFEANEILAMIGPTLNMAIVGSLELAEAAQLTSTAIRAYGFEAKEASRIADIFSLATAKSNMDMRMLGEAFKYIAPVARGAGLKIEELTAAIGLMGNAGIQGGMAGTTLRRAIANMLSPTGTAKKIMKELGLEFLNTAGNLKPFVKIINELGASGASTAQIMEMFGLRAGPGMIALVRMGGNALSKLQVQLENSQGAAERMSQAFRTTLIGRLKDLGASLNELAITVYNTFNESLRDSIFMTRNWVTEIVKALEQNKKLTAIINGLLKGLKPLAIVIENVMKKILEWIQSINVKALTQKFKIIGETISKVFITIIGIVKTVWSTLIALFTGEEMPSAVKEAWNRIGEIIRGAIEGIAITVLGGLAGIVAGIIPVVTNLGKSIGQSLINGLATTLATGLEGIVGLFEKMLGPLTKVSTIKTFLDNLKSDIAGAKTELMGEGTGIIGATTQGLEEGIRSMIEVMQGAGTMASEKFNQSLQKGFELPGMEELKKKGPAIGEVEKGTGIFTQGGEWKADVPTSLEALERNLPKGGTGLAKTAEGLAISFTEFIKRNEKEQQETIEHLQKLDNAISKPAKKEFISGGGRGERMK